VSEPILELEAIEAGYGQAALVLRGLSFAVHPGEVVCLVGPNGAGKSTVLRVASGLLRPRAGRIRLNGEEVTGLTPQKLLARGLAHVLQGHSVFPEMTVGENVIMGGYTIGSRAVRGERLEMVRELFPLVRNRWKSYAGLLSGGEQKMVEFARSMMLDPQILLLDEPSCGLEPRAVATVFGEVDRLRGAGKAILLVEQNARSALRLSDRGCVLDLGRIALEGPAPALLDDPKIGSLYLGGAPRVDLEARA
jgi:branched-chain amino acid transport system ATP-binding protein